MSMNSTAAKREINLAFWSMFHASLPERISAAAGAGFNGISLWGDATTHQVITKEWPAARIKALLDEYGVRVSEIGPLRSLSEEHLQNVYEMVRAFNVPRVVVTTSRDGRPLDFDAMVRWLKKAAARLAPAKLAIEPTPPTQVPDVQTAQRLIEAAGADNIGLCLDTWHVFRGGGLASLKYVDPARAYVIQLNDGPMKPTLPGYSDESRHFRQVCGEGEFDLISFMRMLPSSTPVAAEVPNDELNKRPPGEVAKLLYASTVALLQKCE